MMILTNTQVTEYSTSDGDDVDGVNDVAVADDVDDLIATIAKKSQTSRAPAALGTCRASFLQACSAGSQEAGN